jgi:signal transduction histidine kinase
MSPRLGFPWRTALLALPLPVIMWMGLSAYQGLALYRQSVAYVNQTIDLLSDTDTLFGLLKDAETGQRGYLLTGNPSYLEPYQMAERDIEQYQGRLERLASQDSTSQGRTGRLRVLIRNKMAELKQTIVLYRAGKRAEALEAVETDRGKHLMDQIRLELAGLHSDTENLLLVRRQTTYDVVRHASLIGILGSVAVFLLGMVTIKHDARRRSDAARIHDLNLTLEEKVEQRTRSLAESNRELEAFSYSVSHDLRAPLRSLEGFSTILTRDYSGRTLDDRGLGLLKRMSASAVRMGQLIDDLLNLSRISRTELEPRVVDLSALAAAVATDLQEREPARNVEIRIQPGVIGTGDAPLLRIVLENLLGNAWKFTRNAPKPCLEFGRQGEADGVAYYIRDNGAGFDMAHAGQLFVPFQRLHRSTEFEGTGIGLATVHRVIERHGGRIWAQSSPGEGASFYFTVDTDKKVKHAADKIDSVSGR